jgi:hypothetical protein
LLGPSFVLSRTEQDGFAQENAEEFQAKYAQRNVIASKMKQEEAEGHAQLVRLASFPETPNKLPSQEPATSADARSAINGGPALLENDS